MLILREPCGDNLHGKAFIKGDRSTFRFWQFAQHDQAGVNRNLAKPLLTGVIISCWHQAVIY